jgi:phage repressor protein C with HTH and peptisase S24 domain
MSRLLRENFNAHYATGSRAFTETLRSIIGRRGAPQFKYFNSYGEVESGVVDVLICDEAHRLRRLSGDRFRPSRTGKPQVEEILDAGKLAVFLIDDRQVVRPDEIGSSTYIKENAVRLGCEVREHTLEAQFRCAGSDGFVNWIANTLGVERTANAIWEGDERFDFRVFPSPDALEKAIRARSAQGHSARLAAGFCWRWSKPRADGTLVGDVVVGTWQRPWNAKPEATRLAAGIPKAQLWAHDPGGLDQVGCVYTTQGFEFDYIGVVFGRDLRYDLDTNEWVGDRKASFDVKVKQGGEKFVDLVKNTYRVLLSRGLKGCYVCFLDRDTERFFRTRIDGAVAEPRLEALLSETAPEVLQPAEPFRRLGLPDARPFENCVPLYDLAVAAGAFSEGQDVDEVRLGDEDRRPEDFTWVELPEAFRPRRGLFVARVVGESMNRRIPNGAFCLFGPAPKGSRQGRVVIAQHRQISDPETGGQYTVKVYESTKAQTPDDSWRHAAIVLRPDTTLPGFEPIVLSHEDASELRVVAALIAVLG